jgi:hypothetical protein
MISGIIVLQLWKVSFVMAQNQQTSAQVASIAAKAMQNPSSLSSDEIRQLAASVQNESDFNHQSSGNNQQGQPKNQSNPNNQQGHGSQQSQRK